MLFIFEPRIVSMLFFPGLRLLCPEAFNLQFPHRLDALLPRPALTLPLKRFTCSSRIVSMLFSPGLRLLCP
jgi:hypothetical protein